MTPTSSRRAYQEPPSVFSPLPSELAPRPVGGRQLTVVGVDVGQIHDSSAICIVRYEERQLTPGDPLFGELPMYETHYTVRWAERLELGTTYPAVAARVAELVKRMYDRDSRGDYHLLCDATGVGRPVIDMLRVKVIPQCIVTAVTLTGGSKGDQSILWRRESSVSKAWLVSRLQAILQGRRLHAPRPPADASPDEIRRYRDMLAMIEELKVYEIRTKPDTGNDQFGAFTVGTHDDLVTALALACSSELQRVRVGPEFDQLPSPVL